MEKINIKKIVEGKRTYPSWSTNSSYILKAKEIDEDTLVHYTIKGNREIGRTFPKEIKTTPKFCYILGLLKGEGANSLGKSNYRRVTLTNSDPKIINSVLNGLEESKLFRKSNLLDKSIHLLHHTETDEKVVNYWSKQLNLPKNKFKCYDDKTKTSALGVCHVYISDVLLRRVLDILHEEILK